MEIIPSILTSSVDEVDKRLKSIQGLNLNVQIDFMDGQFVETKSVLPEDLPEGIKYITWEAHLMVQDPLSWSRSLYGLGCQRIYWQVEVLHSGIDLPSISTKIEHGLALKLETSIDSIESYLPYLKSVLFLSIQKPGYQNEKFEESIYDKIKELKYRYPKIKITVDGGVKIEHMKPLSRLGVDRVAVGSAFWQYGDPKTVLSAFRQATL